MAQRPPEGAGAVGAAWATGLGADRTAATGGRDLLDAHIALRAAHGRLDNLRGASAVYAHAVGPPPADPRLARHRHRPGRPPADRRTRRRHRRLRRNSSPTTWAWPRTPPPTTAKPPATPAKPETSPPAPT
ncbi:hypothetical protein ACU686_09900 [Yinghuangia aomiensis]